MTTKEVQRLSEALAEIDRKLDAQPRDAGLWVRRAHCLHALGLRTEMLEACGKAEECAPKDAAFWDGLGSLRSQARDQRGALAAYEVAIALAPGEPRFLYNRATVRRFVGDLEGAESDYDAVIAINPGDEEAYLNRSELRTQTIVRNHIDQLEARIRAPMREWQGYVQLHYALAKEHEDIGNYARAFEVLRRGAQLRRAHMRYDLATDLATVEWIREAYPTARKAAPDAPSDDPVFILGLPRSGTTLVERILGRHTALSAAGELDCFAHAAVKAVSRLGGDKPSNRHELIRRSALVDFGDLGRDYLHCARAASGLGGRFIDKMPLNYLYCGLIQRALPSSRIVQIERHPMALGYAIFKTLFKDGYPFSYDLTEIGQYLCSYQRLMEHWNGTLTQPILQVRYEDVIRNIEQETRRLLAHCTLEWQAACVDFHRNPDASTTASAAQVREPLYSRSLEQWRHYSTELEPLRAALLAGGVPAAELD